MHKNVKYAAIIMLSMFLGAIIGITILSYYFLSASTGLIEDYRDCVNDWGEKMADGIRCERMLGECILDQGGMYG